MEYTTDIATNSNSSSFLICHSNSLTQNQENLLKKWAYSFFERELITLTEAEYIKMQTIIMLKDELSNGLQISTEEELKGIFKQHKFKNALNTYNFFLKRLRDGKSLTKVSIEGDLELLGRFRNICNILNRDLEFNSIEEKEELVTIPSSSSSFIVARREQFRPEQKEEIIKFFKKQFLGNTIETKEELTAYFINYIDYTILDDAGQVNPKAWKSEEYQWCLDLLSKGFVIHIDDVKSSDHHDIANIYMHAWNSLSRCGGLIQIDTSLDEF